MEDTQFLGYLVMAIITLGGFVTVIQKFTQPINDLKVVIQELRDCIGSIKEDNANQNRRIDEQGKEIDKLKADMTKIQTKVDLYHGK